MSGVMTRPSSGDSDLGSEWASAPVTQTMSGHNVFPQCVALQRASLTYQLTVFQMAEQTDRHPGH